MRKPGDPVIRLMGHVKKTRKGCWLWTGGHDRNGYGHFFILADGRRKIVYPHRWLYEQTVGKVPKGKVLLHVCRNPNCVNPTHLELTTYRHILSLSRGKGMPGSNRRKTCCKRGLPAQATARESRNSEVHGGRIQLLERLHYQCTANDSEAF